MVQGTAAFATKEGSEQRSFRNEYIVPFALIAVYGIANQHSSNQTGANDNDLNLLIDGLWNGTANLITRSKVGHEPQLLVQVTDKEGFNGIVGSLDDRIEIVNRQGEQISDEEQLALRTLSEVKLDVSKASEAILYTMIALNQ